VLGISTLATGQGPAMPKKVASVEGITEYRLDNGLRVLLFPDKSAPKVTVNLTIFVGSRHEGYGETGMAHLLEHMLFKGTPTHKDIPKDLKAHGADYQGTTWVDRTNYYETMPASDENLEFAVKLEADRLVNSLIRREDLITEMTVVRNEFEDGENNPNGILSQRMMASAFEWHNYGKSTIGNRSDIERVPIDSLQAFYKKFYRPDNSMLVIAGKFDEKKALDYVAKYFGPLKNPKERLPKTYTEEPAQDGERSVTLRRVGKVGAVGAMYHIPAGSDPDFPAVEVLTTVLASEPSGRLYKSLVSEGKLASGLTGYAMATHDPGVIEFQAQVSEGKKVEDVRAALVKDLDSVAKTPITAKELKRARRELLAGRERLMTQSDAIAITLSEWGAQGDWRLFFLHRDRLEKVTEDDVNRVARKYLQPSNRTVGMFIPTEKPDRVEIGTRPKTDELVEGYKGRDPIAPGEEFDATPENIEKRIKRQVLASGVKAAVLMKKTRGESVVLELTLDFGNEESLKGLTTAARFLGPLMRRGTRKLSREDIQDRLDDLSAQLGISTGTGSLNCTIVAKHKTLPEVLALLHEILRDPSFPASEFEILKRESIDSQRAQLTEPQSLAMDEYGRKLAPYPRDNIRYSPTLQEQIERTEKVTLDDVKKVYAQIGAQHGQLAVVGDCDPDKVIALVEKALAGWTSKVPYQRIASPARTDVPGERLKDILTPDKTNAFFVAGNMLALTDTDPDFPALRLASYLFGEDPLSSRLAAAVRQKEGLSYAIGSSFSAHAQDKSASFTMYAIANPENLPKVDEIINAELTKLIDKGVDEKELKEAQDAYLKMIKLRFADDSTLASILTSFLEIDRKFDFYIDLEKKVRALKPADVNAAVKKHFSTKKLIFQRAGDFKKKGEDKN